MSEQKCFLHVEMREGIPMLVDDRGYVVDGLSKIVVTALAEECGVYTKVCRVNADFNLEHGVSGSLDERGIPAFV